MPDSVNIFKTTNWHHLFFNTLTIIIIFIMILNNLLKMADVGSMDMLVILVWTMDNAKCDV